MLIYNNFTNHFATIIMIILQMSMHTDIENLLPFYLKYFCNLLCLLKPFMTERFFLDLRMIF
jgi:hypothetical protein